MKQSEQISRHMTPATWGLLLLLAVIWGCTFPFSEIALNDMPPLTIVLGRVGIAAISLLVYLKIRGIVLPRDPGLWLAFAGMGFLNNVVPFNLIVQGQTEISGSLASILNATTPIFTVVLAHFLTKDEKLSVSRFIGVGCGLAGVAILIGVDALEGATDTVVGQALVMGAATSYAFAGIYGRRFAQLNPAIAATGQLTTSAIMMVPIAFYFDRPWMLDMPHWSSLASVTAMALVSTSAAYIIYFHILKVAGATNLLLVTFLIPVSAVLLGTSFLGETLELSHMMGMAVIAMGLAAIDGRLFRRPS
jgi:drug/metabolite transporter (DMT)-like permease